MISKKGLVIGLATALALGASGSAFAGMITVDGVTWNPASGFDLTIDALNLNESQVSTPGQVLTGYGQVGSINQASFCTGCNLTFQFQYTLDSIAPGPSGSTHAIFGLGSVNFFVSNPGTYDPTNPASAGLGTPWLTLTGHTGDLSGFTGPGQLFSTIFGTLTSPSQNSGGFGYLDATGGPAAKYMQTHTISDGNGGFADFSISSGFNFKLPKGCTSVSSDPNSICHYPISGTANLVGASVPEPGALGMLGLGMGIVGFFFWRRRKEAYDQA